MSSNGRLSVIADREPLDSAHLTLLRCESCAGKEAIPQCGYFKPESHCGIEQQSRHYKEMNRLLEDFPSYEDDPAIYAAYECAYTYHRVAFQEERILRDSAFLGNVTVTSSKTLSALRTRARELERLVQVLQSLGLLRRRDDGEEEKVDVGELTAHTKALIRDLVALGVPIEELIPSTQKQIASP